MYKFLLSFSSFLSFLLRVVECWLHNLQQFLLRQSWPFAHALLTDTIYFSKSISDSFPKHLSLSSFFMPALHALVNVVYFFGSEPHCHHLILLVNNQAIDSAAKIIFTISAAAQGTHAQ